MLTKDLNQKSVDELKTLKAEIEAQLCSMRFKISTRQLTKVSQVSPLKRDLARIATVLRQQSLRA